MTELLPVASAAQVRRALAELARPYRLRITLAALVLVAGTATVLIAPPLLGAIVDLVVDGAPASAITGPVLGLVGVAVGAGVLDAIGRVLVANSGEPILATLREDVVERALAVPPDAVERAGTGDLVSRVSGDVAAVSELFGEALPGLVRSALMVGLTLVGLAVLDWRLALAGLAAAPVQAFALRWYLRVAGPMYAAERTAEGARAQQLLGSIEGAATVRAFRLARVHTERIAQRARAAVAISLHTIAEQTRFFGRLNVAELIGTSAVLVVGFLLVTQEVHTFAGTLTDDLRLARPDANESDLTAALDRVGALAWARALPYGLATVVGAGGHRLTATQAQQLALARLALADPLVAILDEATAEAGSAGARVLEAAALRALDGRTALVVAHRLTQAATADRIVVLDTGRVVEIGTHAELANGNGPYARLWAAWSHARGTGT